MSAIAKMFKHPWWWPLWRRVRPVKWGWQRLRRGWCDRDLWCLDGYIAKVLSEALPEMARVSHSYPGAPPGEEGNPNFVDTYEGWQSELLAAAEAFRLYGEEAWFDDDFDVSKIRENEEARGAWNGRVNEAIEAVTENSWGWLRKWHGALWD